MTHLHSTGALGAQVLYGSEGKAAQHTCTAGAQLHMGKICAGDTAAHVGKLYSGHSTGAQQGYSYTGESCTGALQRKSPLGIPFWEYRGLSPTFYIHVSVKDVHIATIRPPVCGETISNDIFLSGIIRISLWRGGGGWNFKNINGYK
jgi:hypothetical protein